MAGSQGQPEAPVLGLTGYQPAGLPLPVAEAINWSQGWCGSGGCPSEPILWESSERL